VVGQSPRSADTVTFTGLVFKACNAINYTIDGLMSSLRSSKKELKLLDAQLSRTKLPEVLKYKLL
jgi:hypothetical protein